MARSGSALEPEDRSPPDQLAVVGAIARALGLNPSWNSSHGFRVEDPTGTILDSPISVSPWACHNRPSDTAIDLVDDLARVAKRLVVQGIAPPLQRGADRGTTDAPRQIAASQGWDPGPWTWCGGPYEG